MEGRTVCDKEKECKRKKERETRRTEKVSVCKKEKKREGKSTYDKEKGMKGRYSLTLSVI